MAALILSGLFTSAYADTKWAWKIDFFNPNYSDYTFNTELEAFEYGCSTIPAEGTWFYDGIRCKNEHFSTYNIAGHSITCSNFVQLDGTCGDTDPSIFDCSARTGTHVYTLPYSDRNETAWQDSDGCIYQLVSDSPVVCADTTGCSATVTGTGEYNNTAPAVTSEVVATPSNPYETEEVTPSTSSFSTDTVTVDNGDGTTTDTTTDVNTKADNQVEKITYDGETVTTYNNDGTQTNTTTVTTTTTYADGTQSETVQTTSTTTQSPVTTNVTNINTGQTTTSTVAGSTTTTTSGSTSTYDSAGNVTSRDYQTAESTTEEMTDPNCESCVPDVGGYVNPDFSGIDATIESYKTAPLESSFSTPTQTFTWTVGAACVPADWTFTFMGKVFNTDFCTYIGYVQVFLFWVFNILTFIYVYQSFTSLNKAAA